MHRAKVRKRLYNTHQRSKMLNVHVSKELREKLGRTVRVKLGDVVRIMRGDYKGKEGKVTGVDTKSGRIAIEGITRKTASNKEVNEYIHASNVMLIKRGEKDGQ